MHRTSVKPLPAAHNYELGPNVKPKLNDDSLRLRAKKNCNNMCFMLESDEYIVRVISG